jgi:hypothetical protein
MMDKATDPLREEPLKSTTPSQGPILEKIMSSPNRSPTTEEHMVEETSEMEIELDKHDIPPKQLTKVHELYLESTSGATYKLQRVLGVQKNLSQDSRKQKSI